MMTDESVVNIDTIEELSIFGLDRSQEGLDMLLEKAADCGEGLRGEITREGIGKLSSLIQALHDFDLFEINLCTLFNIDRGSFGDSRGDLKSNAELFRKTLNDIGKKIEENDMQALSALLVNDLPVSLSRFKELMPLLRKHIDREYVQPDN